MERKGLAATEASMKREPLVRPTRAGEARPRQCAPGAALSAPHARGGGSSYVFEREALEDWKAARR